LLSPGDVQWMTAGAGGICGMMEKGTGRLEAFSDGVFAIAITLPIIEIKVPHLPPEAANRELWAALLGLWPSFLALVMSFASILIM
jgi:uncharacterized membrane protein